LEQLNNFVQYTISIESVKINNEQRIENAIGKLISKSKKITKCLKGT